MGKVITLKNKQHSPGYVFRWGVAILGTFLVAFIAAGIFHYYYDWPFIGTGDTTKVQPLPKLEPTAQLAPTNLQAFMNSHGPWLSTSDSMDLRSKSGVRNLALLQENGLVYSAQSVQFSTSSPWAQETNPPQITGVKVLGTTVEMQTQKGVRYTLNASQPFMVEGNLTRVYAIDRNTKLWSAPVASLNFVSADSAIDASIPANPNLSVAIGK